MQKIIRIVAILLLTILVVGCSYPPNVKVQMYPGPKVDRDKKAIIRGGGYMVPIYWGIIIVVYDTRVTINQVDGQLAEMKKEISDSVENVLHEADEVEVLPGPHEIGISVKAVSETASCGPGTKISRIAHRLIFNFEAQAGHKYKVKCHSTFKDPLLMNVKSIIVELIDERTKEVIASQQFDQ
jgi:hypothetical protein